MNSRNRLFSEGELRDFLNRRLSELVGHVEERNPDTLLATPTEDLVAELVERYEIEPLELRTDEMEQLPTGETRIDIRQDRNRMIFDRSRPHHVAGSVVRTSSPSRSSPKCSTPAPASSS